MRSLDKFRGCLVGGTAGDALGYSVEFMDYEEIVMTVKGANAESVVMIVE